MRFSWHSVLFAHWPVPATTMRALVPEALELDLKDGSAWVGVVPFRMTRVGPGWLPPIPYFHAFPELNVRTYVTHGGKPGVWFFSLDAANRLAVWGARRYFHLPYFRASMSCLSDPKVGDGIAYRSLRTHRGAKPAEFRARYRPRGPVYRSRAGDLDHWLTERYCLYSIDPRGRLHRADVAHDPWPLQPADAEIEANTMTDAMGLPLSGPPALLHFAHRVDVTSGWARPVGTGRSA